MIRTDAACYLWLAALLLLLPLDWVISAFTAALIHELCHIAALLLLGGKISSIRISVRGCILEAASLGDIASLGSILAGPAGSLALLLFSGVLPKIAVCGLFHGLYNLLPLLPLDGGRALQLLLNRFCPVYADTALKWTGRLVCVVIAAGAIRYVGLIPGLPAILWIIPLFPRKTPCKPS